MRKRPVKRGWRWVMTGRPYWMIDRKDEPRRFYGGCGPLSDGTWGWFTYSPSRQQGEAATCNEAKMAIEAVLFGGQHDPNTVR